MGRGLAVALAVKVVVRPSVLADIASTVAIEATDYIRVAGEIPIRIDTSVPGNWPDLLRARLQRLLYHRWYLGIPEPDGSALESQVMRTRHDPTLVAALRGVVGAGTYWDRGWTVAGLSGHRFVVTKDRLSLLAEGSELEPAAPNQGESVAVALPTVYPYRSPGHINFISQSGPPAHDGGLGRVYLNLSAAGVLGVTARLLDEFQEANVPFSFKTLAHPDAYVRPDSAVLYVSGKDHRRSADLVVRVRQELPASFNPATPAFTLPVASGVAIAEEPFIRTGPKRSFGQHRCGLVASALVQGFQDGVTDEAARLELITTSLHDNGVDPGRTYVTSGSFLDEAWRNVPLRVSGGEEPEVAGTHRERDGAPLVWESETPFLRRSIYGSDRSTVLQDEVLWLPGDRSFDRGTGERVARELSRVLPSAAEHVVPETLLVEVERVLVYRLPQGGIMAAVGVQLLDDPRALSDLRPRFESLGSVLGALHSLDPKALGVPTRAPAWSVPVRALALGSGPVAELQDPLAFEMREILNRHESVRGSIVRALALLDSAPNVVLLHGLPSLGAVWLSERTISLLGWYQCVQGPPSHDLGTVLGEMTEWWVAARAGGSLEACEAIEGLAHAFCAAHAASFGMAADPSELADGAAVRIVGHWIQNVAHAGLSQAQTRHFMDSLCAVEALTTLTDKDPDDARR